MPVRRLALERQAHYRLTDSGFLQQHHLAVALMPDCPAKRVVPKQPLSLLLVRPAVLEQVRRWGKQKERSPPVRLARVSP
jgi:hypothetical protein